MCLRTKTAPRSPKPSIPKLARSYSNVPAVESSAIVPEFVPAPPSLKLRVDLLFT